MIDYKIIYKVLTMTGVIPQNGEDFINYIRNPCGSLVSPVFYMNSYNIGSNARGFFDCCIGKVESIAQYVGYISLVINVEPKLEKVHASKYVHSSTYDNEIKDLVAQVYESDFEVLGYEFF